MTKLHHRYQHPLRYIGKWVLGGLVTVWALTLILAGLSYFAPPTPNGPGGSIQETLILAGQMLVVLTLCPGGFVVLIAAVVGWSLLLAGRQRYEYQWGQGVRPEGWTQADEARVILRKFDKLLPAIRQRYERDTDYRVQILQAGPREEILHQTAWGYFLTMPAQLRVHTPEGSFDERHGLAFVTFSLNHPAWETVVLSGPRDLWPQETRHIVESHLPEPHPDDDNAEPDSG